MYISIGKVSKLIGTSISTLRRWDTENYLNSDYRTKGNHRRYNYHTILQFLGIVKEKKDVNVVIYARVSSSRQKEDLKRQIELLKNYAANEGWNVIRVYSDLGSGLNDNRKKLLKLVKDLPTLGINYILCSYLDRLARFGSLLLKEFCNIFDIEILEVQSKSETGEETLVQSIIAILYSFSGKLYRSRRGKAIDSPKQEVFK